MYTMLMVLFAVSALALGGLTGAILCIKKMSKQLDECEEGLVPVPLVIGEPVEFERPW